MYSSAIVWQRALPGSLVGMCHQLIVTGAAAAADGSVAVEAPGAVDGAVAVDGAGVALPEQAARTIAVAPISAAIRWRDS